MALTKAATTVVQDWTNVTSDVNGSIVVSAELDCSASYDTTLTIQAFLGSTTAHTGTEFTVQGSNSATDNENWSRITQFVALNGTASTFNVTTQSNAGQKVVTTTDVGSGFSIADKSTLLIGLKSDTLANSEVGIVASYTASTNVTMLDNLTNTHTTATDGFNIAISTPISIPFGTKRARVIVNNDYDSDGSILTYRVIATTITAV